MAKLPDVLVLGGGIIGLTSAYLLAKSGLSVRVIDRQEMGREASWAGAGILPPYGDPALARPPMDALRAVSVAGFAAFSEELPTANGYRVCGGIEALDADAEYTLPLWDAEKIAYERISAEELKRLEPHCADLTPRPPLRSGEGEISRLFHLPGFAQLRNPRHLRALITACQNQNVELIAGCPVESWKFDRGRVVGLFDSTGRLHGAGAYLVSTGAWAGGCLRSLGCGFGIHPVRGQIVLYSGAERLLSRVIIEGKRYLVPRGDGRILAGSTEEPEAGFAKATTPAGESDLRCFAENWIPALARATVEQSWAGLRPTSADGLPAIGPVPGHPNVFAAVGHGRAGIQLSLGTARLMLQHVTGGELPAYADAFRLDRPPNTDFRSAFRS